MTEETQNAAEKAKRVQILLLQLTSVREELRRKEREALDVEERLLQIKDELEALGEAWDPDADEEPF